MQDKNLAHLTLFSAVIGLAVHAGSASIGLADSDHEENNGVRGSVCTDWSKHLQATMK